MNIPKTKVGKIERLLERHRNRYAHNQIPYEKARFVQLIHNPLNREQIITVQTVNRLKSLGLNYSSDVQAEQKEKATVDAVLGTFLSGQRVMN